MKALLKTTLYVLLFFTASYTWAQDVVLFTKLPAPAQTFVKKYFSEKDVLTISEDFEFLFFNKVYEVVLRNGVKIVFDSDGAWKELDMEGKRVPTQLVPVKVSQYIRKSFPNTFVKEMKKEGNGYEIEISNGLDLKFSKQGDFIEVDD